MGRVRKALKKLMEQVFVNGKVEDVSSSSSSSSSSSHDQTDEFTSPLKEKRRVMIPDDVGDNPLRSRILGVVSAPPSQRHGRGFAGKVDWIDVVARTASKEKIEETYVFGSTIGKGGFGHVRFCKHKENGSTFACKTIRKEGKPEEISFVHQEVDIMQHLSGYPGIVSLKGFYEESDRFHIVMELCSGGRLLDQMVRDGGRCSETKAAHIVKELMLIINYCHGMGVVHRDIKPENILITSAGTMKLADFGAATRVRVLDGETLCGVIGTPSYAAPEILHQKYSNKVDIWSVGVLLHLMLVGKLPFHGDSWEAISTSIKHDTLNLNSCLWNNVSSPAKDLLGKMLTTDEESRLDGDKILGHPWIVSQTQKLKSKSKLKVRKTFRRPFLQVCNGVNVH